MHPLSTLPSRHKPGLFITATDTGVGKTVVSCAIAWALRQQQKNARIGVCKPFATGCKTLREGLVSEDAEALAHFADSSQTLDLISPVRYAHPLAPAVAEELSANPIDWHAITRSLTALDHANDYLLVEGVGGILVPIDSSDPQKTVLDLAMALGYPVVVVTHAALGTLSHTAMTARLLRNARCRIAGLVINRFDPDSSKSPSRSTDLAMSTNRSWLEKMNNLPILATLPACPTDQVNPPAGVISHAVLDPILQVYWPDIAAPPTTPPSINTT